MGRKKWNLAWLLPGECIPGIVHDTVKVINLPQGVHFPRLHLQKVILLSCERMKRKVQLKYQAVSHLMQLYLCMSKVIIYCEISIIQGWETLGLNRSFLFLPSFPLCSDNLVFIAERPGAPTWLNVFPDNADVFISVRSRMFMPKSNHVTQFMHHDAKLVTVFPN